MEHLREIGLPNAPTALRPLARTDVLVAYRIADGRFPLFDGAGAALYGGRWNSPGRPIVYAARSYPGAMLEILVHANGRMPRHHVAVELTLPPDLLIETFDSADVPGWDATDLIASRAVGDAWLEARTSVALIVPSVVTPPPEANVLLNPAHPAFARIAVSAPTPVRWDARLFAPRTGPPPDAEGAS